MARVQLLTAATATNGGPVLFCTASMTTVAVASLVDAETFTIRTKNGGATVFEFDVTGDGVTAGRTTVDVSGVATADAVRDAVVTAINTAALGVTAASGGAATVTVTSNTAGPDGDFTVAETVANGTFAFTATASTGGARVLGIDSMNIGLGGAKKAHFHIQSTAGSGTMTATVKLWGFFRTSGTLGHWAPLGTHATAASKGLVNEANAMGETGTDAIRHAEVVENLEGIERMYAEITAIGGTSTAISAWLTGIQE